MEQQQRLMEEGSGAEKQQQQQQKQQGGGMWPRALVLLPVVTLLAGVVVLANRGSAAGDGEAGAATALSSGEKVMVDYPVSMAPECVSADLPILNGFDVVAYFSLNDDEPGVQGTEEFSTTYKGYSYWFSSADNLAKFEADPETYDVQYGGFCAWGMSVEFVDEGETTALGAVSDDVASALLGDSYPAKYGYDWTADYLGPDVDPENGWLMVDQKLYVTHDPDVKAEFQAEDMQQLVTVADARWKTWFPDSTDIAANTGCYCAVIAYQNTGSYSCSH